MWRSIGAAVSSLPCSGPRPEPRPAPNAVTKITIIAAALGLLSSLLAACSPTRSRLQPYRDDAKLAQELGRRAREACAARRGADAVPPHPFTTDGCSCSPDGTWAACCVEHDIAYWCGGSRAERLEADRRLRQCIVSVRHSDTIAALAFGFVRVGGVPWLPSPWRWGYGTSGIHGYAPGGQGSCR